MPIAYLDHVNLRTAQLDTLIAWYEAVLRLKHGARPSSSSPGAWLYAGERAVVHLVAVKDAPGAGSEGALKLEHFAFRATGLADFEANLQAQGETYRRVEQEAMGTVMLNLWDPDGNHIHVDFPMQE